MAEIEIIRDLVIPGIISIASIIISLIISIKWVNAHSIYYRILLEFDDIVYRICIRSGDCKQAWEEIGLGGLETLIRHAVRNNFCLLANQIQQVSFDLENEIKNNYNFLPKCFDFKCNGKHLYYFYEWFEPNIISKLRFWKDYLAMSKNTKYFIFIIFSLYIFIYCEIQFLCWITK